MQQAVVCHGLPPLRRASVVGYWNIPCARCRSCLSYLNLRPERLVGDTVYGVARLLKWLGGAFPFIGNNSLTNRLGLSSTPKATAPKAKRGARASTMAGMLRPRALPVLRSPVSILTLRYRLKRAAVGRAALRSKNCVCQSNHVQCAHSVAWWCKIGRSILPSADSVH